ncbi:hypothetical protein RF11_03783 [Thelohanellus kitauei]|uniref:Uncharacterized protein n=1 Tax=Thelohanellus kitauei TaxID=669202 RepID=A0A0C2MNR1_THEKT|nr:hypothetical protein RF11_03783 [Thelohanellus kitauei]
MYSDTLHRNIPGMSADIHDQIIKELKSSPLPILVLSLMNPQTENCSQYLVFAFFYMMVFLKTSFSSLNLLKKTIESLNIFQESVHFLKSQKFNGKIFVKAKLKFEAL